MFHNASWTQEHNDFDLVPFPFTGPSPWFSSMRNDIPTGSYFFNRVWGVNVIWRIVQETNRYAAEVPEGKNGTRGGILVYFIYW